MSLNANSLHPGEVDFQILTDENHILFLLTAFVPDSRSFCIIRPQPVQLFDVDGGHHFLSTASFRNRLIKYWFVWCSPIAEYHKLIQESRLDFVKYKLFWSARAVLKLLFHVPSSLVVNIRRAINALAMNVGSVALSTKHVWPPTMTHVETYLSNVPNIALCGRRMLSLFFRKLMSSLRSSNLLLLRFVLPSGGNMC